jgi:chromosome segregation ATPase
MPLGVVGDVWKNINDFMRRITALETGNDEVKRETVHLRKDLETLQKQLGHSDNVQDDMKAKLADHEARIKELEKRNRGLAISAGMAKAKAAKLIEKTTH